MLFLQENCEVCNAWKIQTAVNECGFEELQDPPLRFLSIYCDRWYLFQNEIKKLNMGSVFMYLGNAGKSYPVKLRIDFFQKHRVQTLDLMRKNAA